MSHRASTIAPALAILCVAGSFPLGSVAADPAVVFSEDFEEGSSGWNATGLWRSSTLRAGSPTHAFHYGLEWPEGDGYNTSTPNRGDLVSPPIDLAGLARAKVSFWTWWESEGSCYYEHPTLLVRVGNASPVVVREMCDATGTGTYEANLTAFVGQSVRLVFRWDTRDSFRNEAEGWYVDDIIVTEDDATPVPSTVDLVVTEVALEGEPVEGEVRRIRGTLVNDGTSEAPAGFQVRFRLDGALVATQSFPPGMPAGYVLSLSTPITVPPPGTHTITIEADVNATVNETDETNNALTASFESQARVWDAYVADLQVQQPVSSWQFARATVRVGNAGNGAIPVPVRIEWSLDGELQGVKSYPAGMPAGWSAETNLTIARPPGSYVLRAAILANNTTDADPSNDAMEIPFVVGPGPDASVEIVALRPVPFSAVVGALTPHPLGRHEALVRICNEGVVATYIGTLHVSNGPYTFGQQVPALAPHECIDRSQHVDAIGDFTVVASIFVPIDDDRSNDRDEANGTARVSGVSVPLPTSGVDANVTAERPDIRPGALIPPAPDQPVAFAFDEAESRACGSATSPQVCNTTRGDPQLGATRPCAPTEPKNSAGFPGWAAWWAARSFDDRRTYPAQTGPPSDGRPINGPFGPIPTTFPVPATEIPVPAGPRICGNNVWSAARSLTEDLG